MSARDAVAGNTDHDGYDDVTCTLPCGLGLLEAVLYADVAFGPLTRDDGS